MLPIFYFSGYFYNINISGTMALVDLLSSSNGYYFFIGLLYLITLLAMITVTFMGLLSQNNRTGSMGTFIKIFTFISPIVLILNTILLAVAIDHSTIIVFFITSALMLLFGIINYAILSAPEKEKQEDLYLYKPKLNIFTLIFNIIISIFVLIITYASLDQNLFDLAAILGLIAILELSVVISQIFAIAKTEKRNNIKVHKVLTLICSITNILLSAFVTIGVMFGSGIPNMEIIVAGGAFVFANSLLNLILVVSQKKINN